MQFQFLCPNDHILKAKLEHVGQRCQCPSCDVEFLIPQPSTVADDSNTPPEFPSVDQVSGAKQSHSSSQASLVRLRCPLGHELETPRESLGQEAECPHCQTRFTLRDESRSGFQQSPSAYRQQRKRQQARFWTAVAIIAAITATLLLAVMVSGIFGQ